MGKAEGVRQALLRQLTHHGWERTEIAPLPNPRWWEVGELWALRSFWSPRGLGVFLIFLINAWDETEPASAWVCRRRPEDLSRIGGEELDLGRGSPAAVPEVFAALERWRQRHSGDRTSPADQELQGNPAEDEAVWLTATDAEALLGYLRSRLSDRKLRLFACACLRRLTHRMEDPRFVRAVEATEEHADGLIPKRAMKRARKA